MSVSIRARLPKGDTNGLARLEEALATDPKTVHVVVGLVQTSTIEARPHDTDDPRLVKTTLLHVEALGGEVGARAEKMLRAAYGDRTGNEELPFEKKAEQPKADDDEGGE